MLKLNIVFNWILKYCKKKVCIKKKSLKRPSVPSFSCVCTMSLNQWRQFNFFDKQQATDPNDHGKSPTIFQVRTQKLRCFK